MGRTRREFLARAGLGVTAGVVGLGVAEIVTRLFHEQRPPVRLHQFSDLVQDVHSIRSEEVFEADPELFWRFRPNIKLPDDARPLFGVVSNAQRLRADHEIEPEKADGEIRILFVGDSCTFGYLVGHDQTFVFHAERFLRERFLQAKIQCINAGVPGYSLFQGWRFLETRAAPLQPDLVVLNFGWNEPESWDGTGDLEHYRRLRVRQPGPALAWSRLCRLVLQVAQDRTENPNRIATRPRVLPYEFRDLLERSSVAAARIGAEVLILAGAGRSNVENTRFRDYRTPFQEEQMRYGSQRRLGPDAAPALLDEVAVLQAMTPDTPTSGIFFDGVHTTPEANRRVGEAIARKLIPWVEARRS
jgi:lysophospholipase L1-like esterase